MKKSELVAAFPAISSTAIQERDGEYVIVGKFCIITSQGGGRCDVWLCNSKDLAEGLSTRKLNILLKKLRLKEGFTVLDGEAYAHCRGKKLIENNLKLLGIRKRRQITEKSRKKLVEQARKLKERKHVA